MSSSTSQQTQEQINQAVDNKFVAMMLQIEKRYQAPHASFQKYEKIRIEQWCKKLCLVTQNLQWKKNRNLYCMILLDQILSKKLGKPFIKMPPDEALSMLAPAEVKAQLSDKFKKFQGTLDCVNAQEKLLKEDDSTKYKYEVRQSKPVNLKNQTTNTSYQKVQSTNPHQSSNQQQNQIRTPRDNHTQQFDHQQLNQRKNSYSQIDPQFEKANQTSLIQQDHQNQNAVKSILKHTTQQAHKKKTSHHKFVYSPVHKDNNKKNIRFDEDEEDLDRQITKDIAKFKVNFQSDDIDQETQYTGNITSTGGEIALMNNSELQGQVIKLKTDNEILNITLKHLQEEINMKSDIVRKQNSEMTELRQMILDLQSENQRLKNQQNIAKLSEGSVNKENNESNNRILSPRRTAYQNLKKPPTSSAQVKDFESFNPFRTQSQNDNLQLSQEQSLTQKSTYLLNLQDKYLISPSQEKQYQTSSSQNNDLIDFTRNPLKRQINQSGRQESRESSSSNSGEQTSKTFKNILDYNEKQLMSFDEEFNKIFNNM